MTKGNKKESHSALFFVAFKILCLRLAFLLR